MKIAIVAGEASGDTLGAGLMLELQKILPDVSFIGVGGPKMLRLGLNSLFPQDRLAVMGLVEPLKRLPELLSMRRSIGDTVIKEQCQLFIGIDSPDFNLGLEKRIKNAGIKTMHYVSPSVWAWRQGRIKLIKKACDHMLTLFPFEAEIYHQHRIPVTTVGHTLADRIPLEPSQELSKLLRDELSINSSDTLIALLPGSRKTEVNSIFPIMLAAAQQLNERHNHWRFIIPAATEALKIEIEKQLANLPEIPAHVTLGRGHEVMAASDGLVLASGTATLEAMLLKKPMVVVYKMHPLSFNIMRWMAKISYVALPNLLANDRLVPELLQDDATADNIVQTLEQQLGERREYLMDRFLEIHKTIKLGADQRAAEAVIKVLNPIKE